MSRNGIESVDSGDGFRICQGCGGEHAVGYLHLDWSDGLATREISAGLCLRCARKVARGLPERLQGMVVAVVD